MKLRNLLFVLLCAVSTWTSAQETARKPKPEPTYDRSFITKDMAPVPNAYYYLPAPPTETEGRFLTDSVMYEEGKKLRQTLRGDTAVADASSSIDYFLKRFSPAVGKDLTAEAYPKLTKLLKGVSQDATSSINKAKKKFARHRPYQHFNEDTPILKHQSPTDYTSYPSGHTVRAWAIALTLVDLCPENANAILKVGYEMGQSRVILGYHYQSDVDAARLAASGVFARLCAEKKFLKALEKARKELNK